MYISYNSTFQSKENNPVLKCEKYFQYLQWHTSKLKELFKMYNLHSYWSTFILIILFLRLSWRHISLLLQWVQQRFKDEFYVWYISSFVIIIIYFYFVFRIFADIYVSHKTWTHYEYLSFFTLVVGLQEYLNQHHGLKIKIIEGSVS